MKEPAGDIEPKPGEDEHSNSQPDPPTCKQVMQPASAKLALHSQALHPLIASQFGMHLSDVTNKQVWTQGDMTSAHNNAHTKLDTEDTPADNKTKNVKGVQMLQLTPCSLCQQGTQNMELFRCNTCQSCLHSAKHNRERDAHCFGAAAWLQE